jgi:hypothetical protein
MVVLKHFILCLIAVFGLAVFPNPASAERTRYRYVPTDNRADVTLQFADGERWSYLGTVRRPDMSPPRPTYIMSFTHPATGRHVAVPVALPASTPRIEYGFRRVTYNYGSYAVAIVFLADGSVEVVYNSGLLRAL